MMIIGKINIDLGKMFELLFEIVNNIDLIADVGKY